MDHNNPDTQQQDRDQERAELQLAGPLKSLAANMMRICRGAGKPERLLEDCIAVAEAFSAYRDVFGHWPSSFSIQKILTIENEVLARRFEQGEQLDGENLDWLLGIDTLIRGSLQMAASRLAGQGTQEARGSDELFQGLEVLEGRRRKNAQDREQSGRP